MDLNNLKPAAGARKTRKRVGRGPSSGTGKTSGRGHKGQKSRSGYSRRYGFEGGQMPLNRRLPKRGFNHHDRFPFAIVNLDALEKGFDAGAEVDADALYKANLAAPTGGGVKILARGELKKKLTVKAQAFSAAAVKAIEAAGGKAEVVTRVAQSPAEEN
jgi:large subunit ribosomal protein L15